MKRLAHGLSVRGDSLYCPLSFSLDTYWNCLNDCHHCYLRRLNRTWGQELRPLDVESFQRKLTNGLKNPAPKSPIAQCLAQKKTLRFGNKADPFQKAERTHRVSRDALRILRDLEWSYVLQTMCTEIMMDYEDLLVFAGRKGWAIVQPIISPGFDRDWEILERSRTTKPRDRLKHIFQLKKQGVPVAVNGEPFIPGFHTVDEFEGMMKLLKAYGITIYNTYNLHFNDHVAKRFHSIGLDIEKIWIMNQDAEWRKILPRLLDLGKKYGIRIGCPDFVNTGWGYREGANTCCGVEVPNPTTFNSHFMKKMIQDGIPEKQIFQQLWDGIGNKQQGWAILTRKKSEYYTMGDVINHTENTK